MIDLEENDNAISAFKNQEFGVIEITKNVENFLEKCKEFDVLYKTNFEKSFDKHISSKPIKPSIVKPSIVPNQRIVIQNCPYRPSLEYLATVQNIIVHSNHPKSSTNSKSSEKLLLEKQKASILASQAE